MAFEFIKPTLADIKEMRNLVSVEVKNGVILDRSEDEMANTIRSYIVARDKGSGEIAGFCALYVYSVDLAEVRSLVVKDSYRGSGLGSELVTRALQEGKELGIKEVLVLTYKAKLFQRLGLL